MGLHNQKKPLSVVGLGAITAAIAVFVGVFIATAPDDIPESTSAMLNQDQGVPNNAIPTTTPIYKGRYKPGQALEGAAGTPAAPVPGGKDTTEETIKIDVPAVIKSVAPKTTVVPVPKTTVPAPKPTTVAPPPVAPKTTVAPPPVVVDPPVILSSKCSNIGVAANVQVACNKVLAAVTGIPAVGGFGQRPGNDTSCHPRGLALDFMVYSNKALGDRIYTYVKEHRAELGATGVILWQVPDHYDHVHVSFEPCRG